MRFANTFHLKVFYFSVEGVKNVFLIPNIQLGRILTFLVSRIFALAEYQPIRLTEYVV